MLEWFFKGGFFMWPILICSIWALGLALERFWFYTSLRKKIQSIATDAFSKSSQFGTREAYQKMIGQKDLLSEVLQAAWDPQHQSVSESERNVEEVLHHHKPELEQYLSSLATLASIQPLLGLLGTITGMIATFQVIAAQGTGNPQAMADGIAEAMITTQAGLCCALPTLLAHNFLRSRLKGVLSLLQKYSAKALKEVEKNLKSGREITK